MNECGAPYNIEQDEETGRLICHCVRCEAAQRKAAAMRREMEESGMFDDFYGGGDE